MDSHDALSVSSIISSQSLCAYAPLVRLIISHYYSGALCHSVPFILSVCALFSFTSPPLREIFPSTVQYLLIGGDLTRGVIQHFFVLLNTVGSLTFNIKYIEVTAVMNLSYINKIELK